VTWLDSWQEATTGSDVCGIDLYFFASISLIEFGSNLIRSLTEKKIVDPKYWVYDPSALTKH
jgi:hypothetical protein